MDPLQERGVFLRKEEKIAAGEKGLNTGGFSEHCSAMVSMRGPLL